MVHMKNKYSTLLSELVLNGKRIIAICGIAVGMGNMDCGCFKKLFNCGTSKEGEEPNNEEWFIDTVTVDTCTFKCSNGGSHEVKDGDTLVVEATVTGGVDENQKQVGPIRIKEAKTSFCLGHENLKYGEINISVLNSGDCAVLDGESIIDPVTCQPLGIFNKVINDSCPSTRISYKVVGFCNEDN